MAADLGFGVRIVGVPIVRDPDGLALSSRNAYLTTTQRRTALALSRALAAGVAVSDDGADAVLAAADAVLAAAGGLDVDYLTLASPEDLRPIRHGNALLLVAARIGSTRLIDNIELTLPGDNIELTLPGSTGPADPASLGPAPTRPLHPAEPAEPTEPAPPVRPAGSASPA
jgi:pantoate--beta-alanine ligase